MDVHQAPRTQPDAAVHIHRRSAIISALVSAEFRPDASVAAAFVGENDEVTLFLGLVGEGHSRNRRQVARHVSPGALSRYQPVISSALVGYFPDLRPGETVPIGAAYLRPAAARAVLDVAGIDASAVGAEVVARWAYDIVNSLTSSRRRTLSSYKLYQLADTSLRACSYGPGLVQDLVADGADKQNILGVLMPLLTIGVEAAARTVLGAIVEAGPDWREFPELTDAGVDELVARTGIVPTIDRLSRTSTTVDGHRVSTHDRVRLHLPTGRSESSAAPIPFGVGPHYCLGAAWIRLFTQCAGTTLRNSGMAMEIVRVENERTNLIPGGRIEVDVTPLVE